MIAYRSNSAGERFRKMQYAVVTTGLAMLLCFAPVFSATGWGQTANDESSSPLATVSVATKALGPEIPSNFLGISLELGPAAQTLNPYAGAKPSSNAFQPGEVEQVMHALGHPGAPNAGYFRLMKNLGPGILRLGGSQDVVCWDPAQAPNPKDCKAELKPEDLKLFSEAAKASGWLLIIGLNLKQNSPSWVLREVTEGIAREIKPELVLGLEPGNEPEGFVEDRPKPYTETDYTKDYLGYLRAFKADPVAEKYGMVGPATCCFWRNARDLSIFADGVDATKNMKWLTVHYYATSSCLGDNVTAEELLSPERKRESDGELKPLVEVARSHGVPIAMAETNSVSCGGMPGVSNGFASALWALDHLFTMAEDGFVNVDFHASYSPESSYNPVYAYETETAGGRWKYRNVVEPLYYALYLFGQNASGAHLLPVSTEGKVDCSPCQGPNANIRAYAVRRSPDSAVKVFVINKDLKASGLVQVRLDHNMGRGSLLLLDAPGVMSLAGDVRYGGQQFDSDGIIAAPTTKAVTPDAQGNYEFTLPNAAAAVLTVEPMM